MRNTITLFTLFLAQICVSAQDLLQPWALPLYYYNIPDSIFNPTEIRSLNIKEVQVNNFRIDIEKLNKIDFFGAYVFQFNDYYKIMRKSFVFPDGKHIDNEYYYNDSLVTIKTLVPDSLIDKSSLWFKVKIMPHLVERQLNYINNKEVSRRVIGHFVADSAFRVENFDTLLYNNKGNIEKEICYYYDNSGKIIDTALVIYEYDTLDRLIKRIKDYKYLFSENSWIYLPNPSQIYYSTHTYLGEKIRKVVYSVPCINDLPTDTIKKEDVTIEVKKINKNLSITELSGDNGNVETAKLNLTDRFSNSVAELQDEDYRRIEYVENTNLPLRVVIYGDRSITIYHFKYIKHGE